MCSWAEVESISSLEHGGNLRQATAIFGEPTNGWVDLSTGINPQPYPLPSAPLTQAALWHRLPEADCLTTDRLTEVAADYYSSAELISLPGSQAAIPLLPALRGASRVAIPQPEYAEHARAWQRWGHQVERIAPAFVERGPAANPGFDVLLLSNPNNPTGKLYSPELLQAWHASLRQRGGWLVVDEAFVDTCPAFSLSAQAGSDGLIILRSLGKFFGLAGARVGFLLGPANLRNRLSELLGPWPLSGPSRLAAAIALADSAWQRQERTRLATAAARLEQSLTRAGFTVTGRNSLYCWVATEAARDIQGSLAEQGIWLRGFDAPAGLRCGLPGDEESWRRLREALRPR